MVMPGFTAEVSLYKTDTISKHPMEALWAIEAQQFILSKLAAYPYLPHLCPY
jgi:hypothetical protein